MQIVPKEVSLMAYRKLDNYYVKELADFYGVSSQTIREYDKKQLLPSSKNAANGYRTYAWEDFVTMDYIYRLRKLEFPLNRIRTFANEASLPQMCELADLQCGELQQKLRSLQLTLSRAEDYHQRLSRINDAVANPRHTVEFTMSPRFLVRNIGSTMDETVAVFDTSEIPTAPLLSLEAELDALSSLQSMAQQNTLGAFMQERGNRALGNMMVSCVCPENFVLSDPTPFRVVEPFFAAHAVAALTTNQDYNALTAIFSAIASNGYRIAGNLFAQFVTNCYCNNDSREYIELWVAVESNK